MRTHAAADRSAENAPQWIAPGTSLAFGVLMMVLGPLYSRGFGPALPAFSQTFLAIYPLWIAIGCAGLAIAVVADQFPLTRRWRAALRLLDVVLMIACVAIVICGIVALFLPLLIRVEPI